MERFLHFFLTEIQWVLVRLGYLVDCGVISVIVIKFSPKYGNENEDFTVGLGPGVVFEKPDLQ